MKKKPQVLLKREVTRLKNDVYGVIVDIDGVKLKMLHTDAQFPLGHFHFPKGFFVCTDGKDLVLINQRNVSKITMGKEATWHLRYHTAPIAKQERLVKEALNSSGSIEDILLDYAKHLTKVRESKQPEIPAELQ